MKIFLILIAWLMAALARGADGAALPASSLAPLESLVGGVWVATLPTPKDQSPLHIELRFAWSDNRRAIHFSSAFLRGDRRQPYTDGFYAWNAAKGKLAIFYTDSNGSLTEGLITADGDTLVNELISTGSDGKAEPIQVRLTKEGNDVFTNAIFVQKNGGWESLVTVRYERAKQPE